MNVIAVNGSPRKDWNTAILLESALEGAGSTGARTDLVHRYDLTYKGCKNCFSSVHCDVLFENHALVLRILKGTTEVLTSARMPEGLRHGRPLGEELGQG